MKWKIKETILKEVQERCAFELTKKHDAGFGDVMILSAQAVYMLVAQKVFEIYGRDINRLPRCHEVECDNCQHLWATQKITLGSAGKHPDPGRSVSTHHVDGLREMWNKALEAGCMYWSEEFREKAEVEHG